MTSAPPPLLPHRLTVGGLALNVYGLPLLRRTAHAPAVSVLFFLHGRQGSAAALNVSQPFARLFHYATEQGEVEDVVPRRQLLVVTMDAPNHGERMVDEQRNWGWRDTWRESLDAGSLDNASHVVDLYAIETQTAREVSFLIDLLPSALFPNGEARVEQWCIAGISLGGHSTWLALAHEPRLTLGIPIIASPDVLTLLSHRAQHLLPPLGPLPLPLSPPILPASLLSLIKRLDPVNQDRKTWEDKRLLVLSGADDTLVPFVGGGTESFLDWLQDEDTCMVVNWVEGGVGHRCSDMMMELAARFVWTHSLTREDDDEEQVIDAAVKL